MKFTTIALVVAGFLLIISFVASVQGAELLCLRKGETVRFSECNSVIHDRRCTSSGGCQYCVNVLPGNIYCPASINACHNDGSCNYLPDGANPEGDTSQNVNVTSVSPLDQQTMAPASIDFMYNVVNTDSAKSCTLIVNGRSVRGNQSRIVGQGNVISYSLNRGNFTWLIECAAKNGRKTRSESRQLFIVNGGSGSGSLGIVLLNPSEGNSVNGPGPVSVNFEFGFSNVTNKTKLNKCSFFLNNNETVLDISKVKLTGTNTVTRELGIGSHSWYVRCLNKTNAVIQSETRSFSIVQPTAEVNQNTESRNSGGGGGGGGSKKTTQKLSTNTTNSSSNDVIKLNAPASGSGKKVEANNLTTGTLNETNDEIKDGITGAVIGEGITKTKVSWFVFLIIAIVGVLALGIYGRKRKKLQEKFVNKNKKFQSR